MGPARIAIVGCGGVSRMHFDAYSPHPDRVEIVAACDPVATSRSDVADRYGVRRTYDSVERLLDDAGDLFDIGVVCTPTPVRLPVVERLAAAGKHVFVEKPFADTLDEAAAMVAVAERSGVRVGVNQNFRYHYPFDIARGLIADGRLGRVVSVIHQDLMLRRDQGWRTETRRHALSVMGVHWFDGLRWMLRDEAAGVRARQAHSPAIGSVGETEFSAIVTFTGGTIATVTESFSSPFKRTDTVVIGDRGTLVLTYAGATLHDLAGNQAGSWETPFPGPHKPGATLRNLELLVAAIAAGEDPPNSGQDNLRTIALLDAAYRAAETDAVVSPETVGAE